MYKVKENGILFTTHREYTKKKQTKWANESKKENEQDTTNNNNRHTTCK